MSVEQKVRNLESLLERIDANRRPLESFGAARVAAAPIAAAPVIEAPTTDPVPDIPASAVVASERPRSATPMEQALSVELEVEEPSIEIDYDDEDDGPIITIEPGPPQDADDELDGVPTAPVGTPAVPRAATPQRLETRVAKASAPVANVVSRAAPRTFGEMLDRTLALRPS